MKLSFIFCCSQNYLSQVCKFASFSASVLALGSAFVIHPHILGLEFVKVFLLALVGWFGLLLNFMYTCTVECGASLVKREVCRVHLF